MVAGGADEVTNLDSEVPSGKAAKPKIRDSKPDVTAASDEETRQLIAFILLTLLFAIVIASFVLLYLINGSASQDPPAQDAAADADRLMALINVIFGPVVTLFSSVVGFYFGARTAKEAANNRPPLSGV